MIVTVSTHSQQIGHVSSKNSHENLVTFKKRERTHNIPFLRKIKYSTKNTNHLKYSLKLLITLCNIELKTEKFISIFLIKHWKLQYFLRFPKSLLIR